VRKKHKPLQHFCAVPNSSDILKETKLFACQWTNLWCLLHYREEASIWSREGNEGKKILVFIFLWLWEVAEPALLMATHSNGTKWKQEWQTEGCVAAC